MFSTDTNRAQRVLRLLRVGEQHGLDRAQLLASARLTEAQVEDPDARVPIDRTLALWQALASRIDNPDLGLEVGASVHVREAGVVGYAMLYSDDLLGAVRRVVRFAKLLNQRVELSLTEVGDRWRLQAENQLLLPDFRQPIDESLVGLLTTCGQVLGRKLEPASIHLPYPRPDDTRGLRRHFGSRLSFAEPEAAIYLWRRDMGSPTTTPDPSLTHYLDQLAEIRMEQLPRIETWSGRVRQVLWPQLSEGIPPIDGVAAELAVSSRSLQRRLREEGTSFAKVVDALRMEKARLLLSDPALAIYEIGFLLGYTDPSTFYRAFRRWQGISPRAYRALRLN